MQIALFLPPGTAELSGNVTTARRWAELLGELGEEAQVLAAGGWPSATHFDVVVALHARKCAAVLERAAEELPLARRILLLTGTDLYVDGPAHPVVARSLALAHRIAVLHERARGSLPSEVRGRVHVIHQSVRVPRALVPLRGPDFTALCVANLRPVKDPELFATAIAALPAEVLLRGELWGSVLDRELGVRIEAAARAEGRFHFVGSCAHEELLARIAGADVLVSTSLQEGGSNVVSEAVMLGTPVLSTATEGSVGLLGEDHPGLFPVGDAEGLVALLLRMLHEPEFVRSLKRSGEARKHLFDPERERQALESLIAP